MQRNNSPVLLITIVLGVLALGATAFWLLRPSGPAQPTTVAAVPTPTPASRWVAARDIPPRTVITPAYLVKSSLGGSVPDNAIKSVDDIKGMLTKETIMQGETVLVSSFTPRIHRMVDANIAIPTGMRGVAIWVDPDQTAAGLVDVGDHVDVIATHKLTYEKGPNQFVVGAIAFTAGRTVGQNLVVLGVDRSIKAPAPTPTPVPGAPPVQAPPPTPVPVASTAATRTRVLLAAPPEIAEHLIAANDQGVLHILIRNPSDGDAGLVPEAREYPSRVVTIAPKTATALANKISKTYTDFTKNVSDSYKNSLNKVPPLPPVNLGPVPTMGPPEPPTREITVVRGTEKTRVIVPQR